MANRRFHRGESIYDRFQGDPGQEPNPCLGPVAKPPFYALPVYPSVLGTKGGAVIDVDARVMHVSGRPIEGLYKLEIRITECLIRRLILTFFSSGTHVGRAC